MVNEPAQTEETQEQNEETEPTEPQEEATQEEAPPEEAEAKGEEGEPEEAAEEEPPKPAEEERRRKGGWQRKVERQEREIEYWRQQAIARQGQQPQQQPGQEPQQKDPAAQVQEYVSTLVQQQLQADRAREAQARAQADFQRKTAEVRAANPDFDDVVLSSDMPVSPALSEALLTSERGPEIMYQLAKNPAELARINALPPFQAAREIGRLEAKASSTAAPVKPKSATRPPVPPTNVGGSKASTRDRDDLPISEYKRAFRSKR